MSSKAIEALEEILDLIDKWRTDRVMEHWQYSQLFDVADEALAEPLRNCDVGTAEEQYGRHDSYCMQQVCDKCYTEDAAYECTKCYAKWSQEPYKKGDTDEQK
jgi:hypothetical protein